MTLMVGLLIDGRPKRNHQMRALDTLTSAEIQHEDKGWSILLLHPALVRFLTQ